MLFLKQCNTTKDLKNQNINLQNTIIEEGKRSENNLKALQDTVNYLKTDSLYTKRILAAKESEIALLDKDLADAKNNIKIITKEKIKSVYITDINSHVQTSDVNTKLNSYGDSISLGIQSSNQLFNIQTQTWFNLLPDTIKKQINIHFIDKFGTGKPSQMNFDLNFRLQIVQTDNPDGSKRIYIKPVDRQGKPIDPLLLGITGIKGVDFIDIPAPAKASTPAKKQLISIVVGPSIGVMYQNKSIQPYAGIGISIGFKLGK